jgi:hypothetical protein
MEYVVVYVRSDSSGWRQGVNGRPRKLGLPRDGLDYNSTICKLITYTTCIATLKLRYSEALATPMI